MRIRGLALAVVTLALAGVPARAQDPAQEPQSGPDKPSIKLGPFELRPRLVFKNIGIDNNVFNDHDNPKQDFTFTAAPDLEVLVRPGRLTLSYISGTELVYFRKYTTERSINPRFSTKAELDLTRLRPFVSYSSEHTSSRVNSEIDARARHHPRAFEFGTRVSVASRTGILLVARRLWEEFDPNQEFDPNDPFRGTNLAINLNSETTMYEGAIDLQLTPLTSLRLAALQEQLRFEFSPGRDSDSLRVGPTLTFSPLGLLTGTASVGYRRLESRSGQVENYSGLIASGTLGIVLGGRFKLESTFARDVRYSYLTDTPTYIVTGGRGTLQTQIAGGLDLRLTGGRETLNYQPVPGQPAPGKDTVDIYGGGFGYRVADRVQFAVIAEFANRESQRSETRSYRNDRVMATLTWGVLSQ